MKNIGIQSELPTEDLSTFAGPRDPMILVVSKRLAGHHIPGYLLGVSPLLWIGLRLPMDDSGKLPDR